MSDFVTWPSFILSNVHKRWLSDKVELFVRIDYTIYDETFEGEKFQGSCTKLT